MRNYNFWVYIMTNPTKTVLYAGMTNNIVRRTVEHYLNRGNPDTFAGKYYCYNIIWVEWHQYVYNAIAREKELKEFTREQKLALIAETNPGWRFLNTELCGMWPPNEELLEAVGKVPKENELQ
ncbi:MAG: GIY-YIG nuclease family protein [Saprospiraceae bacterium]|nr:GIY-YIG nuclease family protein [Saprospiraceae bacterium]